jgi:hypothetical protein
MGATRSGSGTIDSREGHNQNHGKPGWWRSIFKCRRAGRILPPQQQLGNHGGTTGGIIYPAIVEPAVPVGGQDADDSQKPTDITIKRVTVTGQVETSDP